MTIEAAIDEELAVAAPAKPETKPVESGDRRLVRRARQGDGDAVEALVRRHWPRAHRAALLIVHDPDAAEDIAQETILAAVHSLRQFDWRRPIGPWLHRIVVNRSLDYLRARERQLDLDERSVGHGTTTSVDVGLDALGQGIVAALEELEPTDRAIVVLRHLLDYRSREIGRLLEMRPTTVRTRLSRAIAQLRQSLAEEYDVRLEND